MRHKPITCGDGNRHAMFLPDGRAPVALLIAVLDVVMDQRRLVEALYRVAEILNVPTGTTGILPVAPGTSAVGPGQFTG